MVYLSMLTTGCRLLLNTAAVVRRLRARKQNADYITASLANAVADNLNNLRLEMLQLVRPKQHLGLTTLRKKHSVRRVSETSPFTPA